MQNTLNFTGEQLRFLRMVKNVKQPVLAFTLGITQQAISKMENKNNITFSFAEKYITALGLQNEEAILLIQLMSSK